MDRPFTARLIPIDLRRRVTSLGLLLVSLGLGVWPYVRWLGDPTLFDDDLTRVGGLRRSAFFPALFRPFNEHLAPLFELVSWICWWGTGRSVEAVATGLLVASYVGWVAAVLALGAVIRLELRSDVTALAAMAWFAQSSVACETVLWYSASSFLWAAATGLGAWSASVRAIRSPEIAPRRRWLVTAAGLAAASPLFSAIGVLAGPLATVRLLAARPSEAQWLGSGWARVRAALVPLAGTIAYVVVLAANPYHGAAVSASVRDHFDGAAALWAALRAPVVVLGPMLLGQRSLIGVVPDALAAVLTLGAVAAGMIWAGRSRHRGFLAVGLGWVVGGYLLAYGARTVAGDRWIFEVGRYHLYPEIGVICCAAAGFGRIVGGREVRSPWQTHWLVVGLAVLGCALHSGRIGDAARRSFRFPDQGRSIAAGLRLEATCASEGVPLAQAIRIIDPIEPPWFPRPLPFHPLLYLFGPGPRIERRPDAAARSAVLGHLTLDDREILFGGLDATRYRSAANPAARPDLALSVPRSSRGIVASLGAGRIFEEFTLPTAAGDPVRLDVAGIAPGSRVEIWWADAGGDWSPARSIRCTITPPGLAVSLIQLPHWRTHFARRFRVVRRRGPGHAADRPVLILETQPE